MAVSLKEFLAKLDVSNDSHWTADGAPRLDVLKKLSGNAATRDEVNKAWPGFSRATAAQGGSATAEVAAAIAATPPPKDTPEGVTAPAPVNEPVVADPEPEAEEPATDEEISEAHEDHRVQTAKLEQLRKVAADAKIAVEKQERVVDAAADMMAKLDKTLGNNQSTISNWLARQAELREQRGRNIMTLRESGVKLKEVLAAVAPSKIDAAMARKNTLHSKRPVRGLTK